MPSAVVIGTVHPQTVDAVFLRCLVATLGSDRDRFPVSPFLPAQAMAGMLHAARNDVIRMFLSHPAQPQYLVFIDTDMEWVPESVWALVETAERHDLPAVNALVAAQGGNAVMFDEEMRWLQPTEDLQQVFCAGMAFMCLRRRELAICGETYGPPAPWFDYQHRQGKVVTEDVIFSQRYHDLGFPIYVDTQIRVGHRKPNTFMPAEPTTESRVNIDVRKAIESLTRSWKFPVA